MKKKTSQIYKNKMLSKFKKNGGVMFELKNQESPSFYGVITKVSQPSTNRRELEITLKAAGDNTDALPEVSTDTPTVVTVTERRANKLTATVTFPTTDLERRMAVELKYFAPVSPTPTWMALVKKNASLCLHLKNPQLKLKGKIRSKLRGRNSYRFVPSCNTEKISSKLLDKSECCKEHFLTLGPANATLQSVSKKHKSVTWTSEVRNITKTC